MNDNMLIVVAIMYITCIYFANSHEVIIACVGDSITRGYGATDSSTTSYPAILWKIFSQISNQDYIVKNFGVAGATMMRRGNYPYWDTNDFEDAKKINPNIVILQFGANDAKYEHWHQKSYLSDYVDMISIFTQLTSKPDIYVCIPPPLFVPAFNMNQTILNDVLPNNIIPKIVKSFENDKTIRIINMFDCLGGQKLNHREYFYDDVQSGSLNDGCHLTDAGYKKIAIEVALSIALNSHSKHISTPIRSLLRHAAENS